MVNKNLKNSLLAGESIPNPEAPQRAWLFRTSHSLEFLNGREPTAQIGHPPYLWPLAISRDLFDDVLDCAEGPVHSGLPSTHTRRSEAQP